MQKKRYSVEHNDLKNSHNFDYNWNSVADVFIMEESQ